MVQRIQNRILVVEDEPDMRTGLQRTLSRQDYLVDTAENGLQAVEKMKRTTFQVVITDLKMPGMDGISVLRQAKGINHMVTVIVLTGHGTVHSAVESMRLGAFDYITKPFQPEAITLAIERALHGKGVARHEMQRSPSSPSWVTKPGRVVTVTLAQCFACLSCVVECAQARLGLPPQRLLPQGCLPPGELAVPLPCMQCENEPCTTVCSMDALSKPALAVPISIDRRLCLGCGSCTLACPRGVLSLDAQGKVRQRCDLCIERLREGQLPVCITTCPNGAICLTTLDIL